MKHLTHFVLLIAIFFCGFIPAYTYAATSDDAGSGFIVVTNPPSADFFTNTKSGTAPLLVSFSDRSSGSIPLDYFWEFGDGSTSTEPNPSHTYPGNGEYTVSLTVTNKYGTDKKTVPAFISVGRTPAASFQAVPTQGTIPLTVTFSDTSGAGVTTWHWDFGDGITSSLQNPTHTYTKTGIYPVSLDTTNRYGDRHLTKPGLINAGTIPNTEFFAEMRTGDPTLTVKFHDYTSGNPSAWLWQFGDGTSSTEKDPVHTYRNVGYYTTTLTAENVFGSDTLARTNHIQVGSPTIPAT